MTVIRNDAKYDYRKNFFNNYELTIYIWQDEQWQPIISGITLKKEEYARILGNHRG